MVIDNQNILYQAIDIERIPCESYNFSNIKKTFVNWFVFSLLGAAFLAVTGVLDKFILEKYVHNSHSYLVALIVLQQVFAFGIFIIMGPGYVYPQSLYAIIVGIIQIAYWAAYLKALKLEEASRIAALVYVYPIFVFPMAYLFLGQALSIGDLFGGLLLVISGILISYRPATNIRSLIRSPAIKYMFLFWIFYATYSVCASYLTGFMDQWHVIMWLSIGNLIAVQYFVLGKDVRSEICGYLHNGKTFTSAIISEEIFSFSGRGALIFAYSLGYVALVSSVAALQPFFTLVYILILGIFRPGLLVEEKDKRTIALKVLAIFLIIIGIYFVS